VRSARLPRRARGDNFAQVQPLPDIVAPSLRVLFVGINPSLRSAAVGHHFAGPGNPFWRLMHAAGFVSEPINHEQDRRILDVHLGLTNLCPRPTRAADELSRAEIARGRAALRRKIARLRPRVVALVGITLYQQLFGHPRSGGPGAKPESLGGARVFVVPNPSGLNASFPGFAHKLVWFAQLRAFADEVAPTGT